MSVVQPIGTRVGESGKPRTEWPVICPRTAVIPAPREQARVDKYSLQ